MGCAGPRPAQGTELGGHAIKVMGWGTEGGKDYWLVANSWNEDWGDKVRLRGFPPAMFVLLRHCISGRAGLSAARAAADDFCFCGGAGDIQDLAGIERVRY